VPKINWFSWYVVWIIITLSAEFPGWPTKYGPNIFSLRFGGDSSGWRTSTVWLWCFRPTVVFLPSNPRHLSIDIPMAMKTICQSRLYNDSSRKKKWLLGITPPYWNCTLKLLTDPPFCFSRGKFKSFLLHYGIENSYTRVGVHSHVGRNESSLLMNENWQNFTLWRRCRLR